MENQRYAPPGAVVDDIVDDSEFQPIRLWPASGRMGRARFFVYNVGFYILVMVVMVLAGLVGGSADSTIVIVLSGVVYVAYLVALVVVLVQRTHDLDLVGWWCLLAFIPFVGLYWLLKRGTPGRNRFGPRPVPNSRATIVLVWVMGSLTALAIVGILLSGVIMGIAGSRS